MNVYMKMCNKYCTKVATNKIKCNMHSQNDTQTAWIHQYTEKYTCLMAHTLAHTYYALMTGRLR